MPNRPLSASIQRDLLDDLAEKLEQVSYHGEYFSALCVFHQDSRPSLLVYHDGYRCAACGAKGSLRKLLQKVSGAYYRVAQSKVYTNAPYKKWFREYGDLETIATAAHHFLVSTPILQAYFKERKIENFIEQGMFGWIDDWLFFPVKSCDGEVKEITIRASKKNKAQAKYFLIPHDGEHQHLYIPNHERTKAAGEMYVPFGVIDAWALEACGLAAATGLAGQQYDFEWFNDYRKPIWIIPDKGEEAKAHQLKYKLGWRGHVLLMDWPDRCKDCDEIKRKHGVKILSGLIQKAKRSA